MTSLALSILQNLNLLICRHLVNSLFYYYYRLLKIIIGKIPLVARITSLILMKMKEKELVQRRYKSQT